MSKVSNMTSSNGNKVANQFIVFESEATYFQSYQTVIAKTCFEDGERKIFLDADSWDYSVTTSNTAISFWALIQRKQSAVSKPVKSS